jgi:hypothetical protein
MSCSYGHLVFPINPPPKCMVPKVPLTCISDFREDFKPFLPIASYDKKSLKIPKG